MSRSRLRCIGTGLRMRRPTVPAGRLACCVAAGLLAVVSASPTVAATPISFAQVPLFLATPLNPNILVMLDTSQSMDATMGGKIISGTDPGTRGNVARTVLRDVIASYRSNFNWGLGSFDVKPSVGQPFTTYAYYLGNASTMVYTNTCGTFENGTFVNGRLVDGVGVSDVMGTHAVVVNGVKTDVYGKLPCVANAEAAANGYGFITFSRSGDDADVNDVVYFGEAPTLKYRPRVIPEPVARQLYGIGEGLTGPNYVLNLRRKPGSSTGWSSSDFDTCIGGTAEAYCLRHQETLLDHRLPAGCRPPKNFRASSSSCAPRATTRSSPAPASSTNRWWRPTPLPSRRTMRS